MIRLQKKLIASLVLIGAAVQAAPAPVESAKSSSLNDRVSVLERMVESRSGMQHRIQGQLDEMQTEVNQIRGDLELHSHKLEQILQRQRELYLEIDRRIEMASIQSTDQASETPADTMNEPLVSDDANTLYDSAVNLILKEKKYELAIPKFQSFLNQFPKSEYAPNAHYWLGLLLFNKQQWDPSEHHFTQVVSFYPDSGKRPDSLLKLGVIAQRVGNNARAMQLFEQVVSEYPDSSVRKLAETRLKSLKSAG